MMKLKFCMMYNVTRETIQISFVILSIYVALIQKADMWFVYILCYKIIKFKFPPKIEKSQGSLSSSRVSRHLQYTCTLIDMSLFFGSPV